MATMKKSNMTRTICALVGILVIVASLLVPVTLAAAETMKWRHVFFMDKYEEIQPGDVEGHVIGMWQDHGLAMLEDGEFASLRGQGIYDSLTIEGFRGYDSLTFEDGSTVWFKIKITDTPAEQEGVLLLAGTIEFTKGTGRFEGIKGSGSVTGKSFLAWGVAYSDVTASYTLP